MKKSHSLLICFALFLLSLILCCKPVKAAEPTVINLSDLEEGCTLYLYEDSVLNLDTDKSLLSIYVGDNELTISGNGTVECNSVGIGDSGKLIMDSGSLVSKGKIYGHGSLIVNNGSITAGLITVSHITINDGNISVYGVWSYSNYDSDFSIYGGHLESKEEIWSEKIYIDDKMFVAEPWNKEPEPHDNQGMAIGYNHKESYGVKLLPRSEVVFADEIILDKTSCLLEPGEKINLSASVLPENASNKRVTWSSSDTSVAFVAKDTGYIEAYSPGKAIITATAQNGGISQTCEITVVDARVSPDGLVIEASSLLWDENEKQPYIKVKYDGVELKEGSDYVVNKDINWDTGLSVTKITGLASADELVIEASSVLWKYDENQPYIKVTYNGVELKEGSDYVVNKDINWDTGLSITSITGLDDYYLQN